MDRRKLSAISHAGLQLCNPISAAKVERILDSLDLKNGDKVADFGAWKCELLIRLIERYHVSAVAIELLESFLQEGRENASGRVSTDSLQFICQDARQFLRDNPAEQYKFTICNGSTGAFGGLTPTLEALKRHTFDGGYLLIGELFWKQKPSPAYLHAFGVMENEYLSHFENIKTAEAMGLTPLMAVTANDDEWDNYEWQGIRATENYCHANPEDPDCEAMLNIKRNWRDLYLQWGRDTLGYGLYLFRK